MREITSHKVNKCNEAITVTAVDGPAAGGASSLYSAIFGANNYRQYVSLKFQNGPVDEGVNGITHEVLLAILIDRLEGFQKGPFACEDNQEAIDGLKDVASVLNRRTKARLERGVEGTHTV